MIGIGVISFNGLAGVQRVVEGVRKFTTQPYRLIVADDGSTDGTVAWCLANNVPVIAGDHRGCAYNSNRAYGYLSKFDDVETFIVLEQDTIPVQSGWDVRWAETAQRMGQVVYTWKELEDDSPDPANDPPWCTNFGAQCVATSREAFAAVGYYDPRFYPIFYSGAHGEWSYRYAKYLKHPVTDYCLLVPGMRDGLELINVGTGWNRPESDRSAEIQRDIRHDEPIYRGAWWNDEQKRAFELDCLPAITNGQMGDWMQCRRMHVHQNLHEFREWLTRLQKVGPRRVIEIGTYRFGTSELMLQAIPSIERLVTVDIENRNAEHPGLVDSYDGRLEFLHADSRDPETFQKILELHGGPADAAFIDGDHSLIGVWNDTVRVLPLVRPGGLIGYHDVYPLSGNEGSTEFFSGLKRQYPKRCEEIDCTAEGGPWEHYGIGVFRV